MAMTVLIVRAMCRSIFGMDMGAGMDVSIKVRAYDAKGASITNARIKHKIMLTKAVKGLTIFGLGISTKSAPLIPAPRETAPRTKIRSIDSIKNVAARGSGGLAMSTPATPHINVTADEKIVKNAYLHLTRLFAVIGEE